ncbi:YcgN family cysteine cluster protein [Pseudomonadota bacterium]
MKPEANFWEQKTLSELNKKEWESLCDGCGRCCLLKLEDEETGEIFFTDVACKLLNTSTCRCKSYRQRVKKVPECLVLDMEHTDYLSIPPESCAYRRLNEGRPLAEWHPLISGDPESVYEAGISVRDNCVSEVHIHPDELEDRIIEFDEH